MSAAPGIFIIMKDVDQYKGTIRVGGVVSTVSADQGMLALIDSAEFARCRVVTCSTLSLPVRWTGSMPAVRDTVRVKGEVSEQKGKLFLEAQELEGAAPRQGGSQ